MTPNPQITEISEMMRQLHTEAERKSYPGIIINCVLGAPSLYALTVPQYIRDVMSTFIDNAAKYTAKGSISYGFDVNDDELYFYVKDTGIGVPRENQDNLFDSSNPDSTLQRAAHMVAELGGDIGVDSRGAGKGATFWFTVPYTPIETPSDAAPQTDSVSTEETSTSGAPVQSNGPTIMIAEDNESNFVLFRSILEPRFHIIHAYNGQEAVDLYRQYANDIKLILMDINMPVMDGYEATRAIRQISQQVPIVAVTAYAFTTDKQRIYENGFNGYISKPISINRLERVISSLLQ